MTTDGANQHPAGARSITSRADPGGHIKAACDEFQPQEQGWPDNLFRALDLERVKRRVQKPIGSGEFADRLDLEVRRVASTLPDSAEGAEVWQIFVSELGEDPDGFLKPWIRRQNTHQFALVLIANSLFLVAGLIIMSWLRPTSRHQGPIAVLLIVVAVTLAAAGLTGWLSQQDKIGSPSLYLLVAPPLILFVIAVIAAVIGRDHKSMVALAGASVAATLVLSAILAWHSRPVADDNQTFAGIDVLSQMHSTQDIQRMLVGLRDHVAQLAIRERRASRWWLATYVVIAAAGAAGATVAGLALPQANGNAVGKSEAIFGMSPTVIAVLAVTGAGATAISTALNPGHEWKAAVQRSKACERLRREVETMYRLDLTEYHGQGDDRKALEYVLDRLDLITQLADPQPSFWSSRIKQQPRGDSPRRRLVAGRRRQPAK
jgi:hypothetical protein